MAFHINVELDVKVEDEADIIWNWNWSWSWVGVEVDVEVDVEVEGEVEVKVGVDVDIGVLKKSLVGPPKTKVSGVTIQKSLYKQTKWLTSPWVSNDQIIVTDSRS